jgi:hypothetical protein
MENDPALKSTIAITSYDGIFKDMYDEKVQSMFKDIRKCLSKGNWTEARDILRQAIEESERSPRDGKTLLILRDEIARYSAQRIDPTVTMATDASWDEVYRRPVTRIDVSLHELPQGVFYLNINVPASPNLIRILGRKVLSDFWIKNKIPELYCSFISADMLLGIFCDQRVTENKVIVHYYPFENSEKLYVMDQVMRNPYGLPELVFPYPLLRQTTHQELCSSPEGWVIDDAFDVMLGCGEERIREYTIKFMKSTKTKHAILYDPACSTGVFLSTLKNAFPDTFTIGQDLSKQMVDISRQRVDEVHCGNAMAPKIKPGTADFCFVRFLNSEVVKSVEAEELLFALLPTVKRGGYMITFGHTPVLLSSANYKAVPDFKIIQCIATAVDNSGIFQYYVLQRL